MTAKRAQINAQRSEPFCHKVAVPVVADEGAERGFSTEFFQRNRDIRRIATSSPDGRLYTDTITGKYRARYRAQRYINHHKPYTEDFFHYYILVE